jgi:hypothetical protein
MNQRKELDHKAFVEKGSGVNSFFIQTKNNIEKSKTDKIERQSSFGNNNDNLIDLTSNNEIYQQFSQCYQIGTPLLNLSYSNISLPKRNNLLYPNSQYHYPLITQYSNNSNRDNNNKANEELIDIYKIVENSNLSNELKYILSNDINNNLISIWTSYYKNQITSTITSKLNQNISNISRANNNNMKQIQNSSFVDILQPNNITEIAGNKSQVKCMLNWLEVWAGTRTRKKKKNKRSRFNEDNDDDDDDILPNLLLLQGPSGSGKTSSVYTCAKQAGFNVIEINVSQNRSGVAVKKQVAEASQSYGLLGFSNDSMNNIECNKTVCCNCNNCNGSNSLNADSRTTGNLSLNLILFDDVDIVFDEDLSFHAEIKQLVLTSKCPIILTSHYPLDSSLNGVIPRRLLFSRPTSLEISNILYKEIQSKLGYFNQNITATSANNNELSKLSLLQFAFFYNCDIRLCLNNLQYLLLGGNNNSNKELEDSSIVCSNNSSSNISRNVSFNNNAIADKFNNGLFVPIISNIQPRNASIQGGETIIIHGLNFLQRRHNSNNTINSLSDITQDDIDNNEEFYTNFAKITVLVGNEVACCELISDEKISFIVPKLSFDGIYNVSITITSVISSSNKTMSVNSSYCGVSESWIRVKSKSSKDITNYFGSTSSIVSIENDFDNNNNNNNSHDDDDFEDEPLLGKQVKNKKKSRLIKNKSNYDSDNDDDIFETSYNKSIVKKDNKDVNKVVNKDVDIVVIANGITIDSTTADLESEKLFNAIKNVYKTHNIKENNFILTNNSETNQKIAPIESNIISVFTPIKILSQIDINKDLILNLKEIEKNRNICNHSTMTIADIDNGLECCHDKHTFQTNNISVHNFNKELNRQKLKDEMNVLLELESHVSLLDSITDSDLIFNCYTNLNTDNLRCDYDDEELNEGNKLSFGYNCRNELQNNKLITESNQLLNVMSSIIDLGVDVKLNKTYDIENSIDIYLNGNKVFNKNYVKEDEMNSCVSIEDATNKINLIDSKDKVKKEENAMILDEVEDTNTRSSLLDRNSSDDDEFDENMDDYDYDSSSDDNNTNKINNDIDDSNNNNNNSNNSQISIPWFDTSIKGKKKLFVTYFANSYFEYQLKNKLKSSFVSDIIINNAANNALINRYSMIGLISSSNTRLNSVSNSISMDYIPLLIRMLQSEIINTNTSELTSLFDLKPSPRSSSRSTRASMKKFVKFPHISYVTSNCYSDNQLDALISFGYKNMSRNNI